ncbi:hypothetical protein C4K24_4111 [Pseudomonas chlororaphis subsp. aurantiaca]|nr:hypothetical protein C4K24_4111 [Pseudomonas chlororaphis subsp. aurantiaca]
MLSIRASSRASRRSDLPAMDGVAVPISTRSISPKAPSSSLRNRPFLNLR